MIKPTSIAKLAQIESARRAALRAIQAQALKRQEEYNINPHMCRTCGTPILMPPDDARPSAFQQIKRKKFCNRSCAATHNNRRLGYRGAHVSKLCASCHKQFRVSPSSVRCEACVADCPSHFKSLFLRNIASWIKGDHMASKHFAKKALIYLFGPACQKCGWVETNSVTKNIPTQLHHIDGNDENHTRINVKLLCPNCHSLTPNFMALNKNPFNARLDPEHPEHSTLTSLLTATVGVESEYESGLL